MIDRRYGRNLPESIFINIGGLVSAYVIAVLIILFSPLILTTNKVIFGKWLSDGSDPRCANEINADLLKKTLDS